MEDYTGVLVEPWEIQSEFGRYADSVMMNMLSLDKRCIVSESVSKYPAAAFDVVTYEGLEAYVDEGKQVFISGIPESVERAVNEMNHPEVTVDENILSNTAVETPSTRRMWAEEISSMVPMYEPDREHVSVVDTKEILSELGMDDVETAPSQFLNSRL